MILYAASTKETLPSGVSQNSPLHMDPPLIEGTIEVTPPSSS